MNNSDFDDEDGLGKDSPLSLMVTEDLSVHSVAVLKIRLEVLKTEIKRIDQAIIDKGDARQSAESFFT